ncbi:MAG: alpha/beta hydrolase-fold protein [Pseudomonadota bacterium]
MNIGKKAASAVAFLTLLSLIPTSVTLASEQAPHSLQSVQHEVMKAKSNAVSYDIMTWTPAGYDESGETRYPVLIVLDGAQSIGMAVATVQLQTITGEARPIIIAGVSTAAPGNHGIQRSIDYSADVPSLAVPRGADYSFWEYFNQYYAQLGLKFEDGFGGTEEFYGFLTGQLLPELQKKYRVDPEEIGLAGFSSGGDFAADTLLRKNTPFTRFIIGSFGADVLAARLPEREKAFAQMDASRPLKVFCGYGGDELADPNLHHYIQSGLDLMNRLKASDQDDLTIIIRGYPRETHGSVYPHIFSSGVRELWGTGMRMTEVMQERMAATVQ